jgi:hypothetical protein
MYGFESLDKLKETIPEFDDIPSTTWWCLILEVFFERTFISKLKEDVVVTSMRVTAVKSHDALRVLGIGEVLDFLFVLIFRDIPFEHEGIWVSIVDLLN